MVMVTRRGGRRGKASSSGARAWIVAGAILFLLLFLGALSLLVFLPRIQRRVIRERFEEADRLIKAGDAEGAIQVYRRIEAERGGTADALRAAELRRRWERYIAEAREAKRPGDEAVERREFEKAWRIYRDVAERYPYSRVGFSAKASMRPTAEAASEEYEKAARRAEAAKRWKEAEDLYRRILALVPDRPGAAEGLKRSRDATRAFSDAMAEAKACVERKEWRRARAWYERALEIIPKDPEATHGRLRALKNIPPPDGMVLILPGDYVVGSDEGEPDERPARAVSEDGFYLDATEVTNRAYARFVAQTGHPAPPHWGGHSPPAEIMDLPVVCVSWEDASAYAGWVGKRLPTEEEWEEAARGPEGLAYPWGDWFDREAAGFGPKPSPVGSHEKDRSPLGCLDMAGNVAEWTATRKGDRCVIKGASWIGFERDRPDRPVADDFGSVQSDPTITVLVDHPEVWGLTVQGFSEFTFYLSGSANGIPVFEVRKYVPDLLQYLSASFVVRRGESIGARRDVFVRALRRRIGVNFRTGWRVVAVVEEGDDGEIKVTVADATGKRRTMTRERRKRPSSPAALGREDSAERFRGVMAALNRRALHEAARAANRRYAPARARFINCGFRCARDLEPAEPLE